MASERQFFSIKEQFWNSQTADYEDIADSQINDTDIKSHDGISFADVKVRFTGKSPWASGSFILFENEKPGEQEVPAHLEFNFVGQEASTKVMNLPDFPIDEWPEDVRELEEKEREREKDKHVDFRLEIDDGSGSPLERVDLYAGNPTDHPNRLVIKVATPGVGEGTGALN